MKSIRNGWIICRSVGGRRGGEWRIAPGMDGQSVGGQSVGGQSVGGQSVGGRAGGKW